MGRLSGLMAYSDMGNFCIENQKLCTNPTTRYNLFALSIQSRLYCAHGTNYEIYSIIVLCAFAYYALCKFQGDYFPAWSAVQWETNLISILVFTIKTILLVHETFVACINSNTTLVFANLYFPFFLRSLPIDLPTVSVCYVQYFAPTGVKVFAHTDTAYHYQHMAYGVRVPYIQ